MKSRKTAIWTPAEREAWRPKKEMTVSQWADKYRVLDERTCAEPGPWRTDRAPYLRGFMDAFSDPDVEEITGLFCSQSGKTEGLLNMIGWAIDQDPGPAMYTMPRNEDKDNFSEDRLVPMVVGSPAVSRHWSGQKHDTTKQRFYFDRMTLYYTGANSSAGFQSKPLRYVFCDEIEEYREFTTNTFNPIADARKRLTTFEGFSKFVKVSTPGLMNGYANFEFQLSNSQEYYMPCPRCGEWTIWKFAQLKVPKKLRDPDEIRKEQGVVWYECEFCKRRIEEPQKEELVAAGLWLPEGQRIDVDGNIKDPPKKSKWRSGFRLSALASPWVPWTRIMADWFEANTEQGVAIGLLKTFKNKTLAQPWEETGRAVKANELEKRRGDFSRGTVPDDCLVLVAGGDYHEDQFGNIRIDYEVRGFGYALRNWVISSGSADSWEELEDEVLFSPFHWSNPDGPNKDKPELAVIQLFIDSGYKPEEIYGFCLKYPGIAMPTKGASHAQRTPLVLSNLEKASQGRAKRYRGMQLMNIDTEFFKNQVTSWAEKPLGQPGSTEYCAELPDIYFTQFCNEQKVKTRDKFGREHWVWKPVKTGAPTHFLDTAVNAAAAAFYRRIQYMRRPGEQRTAAAAAQRTKPPQRTRPQKRPHAGFLNDLPKLTL